MKTLITVALLMMVMFCMAPVLSAQDEIPNMGIAGGLAVNQYSDPGSQIQGWGTFFKRLGDSRVFVLSTFDVAAVPGTQGQLFKVLPQLSFQFRPGLAIPFAEFGKLKLWGLGEVGLAATSTEFNGISTGGSFAGGGMATYQFKPNWGAVVAMRIVKNSNMGTQYLPEFGIAFGR